MAPPQSVDRPVIAVDESDEPPADMFPRLVRPSVFRGLWIVLAVLIVVLTVVFVDYYLRIRDR